MQRNSRKEGPDVWQFRWKYQLVEVRTIQMSVLFNHACRYELFDRNPKYLVRQSAKRRTPPATLMPAAEIKALIDGLALRERTLVLLAASTGFFPTRMDRHSFLDKRLWITAKGHKKGAKRALFAPSMVSMKSA